VTITATVIVDSRAPTGTRLTTLELRYPRFIHAEFLTHRVFSRNSSSSRAIPVSRLIQDVIDDPAMPIHWGKNEPGMQARAEHDAPVVFRHDSVTADRAWLRARDTAVDAALRFSKAGYHKQIVNRLLEPFAHINTVVTATDWENWVELRAHPDAQPEIHALAIAIRDAMFASDPVEREHSWHMPYITEQEFWSYPDHMLTRASAARCARVSYKTHEGKPADVEQDQVLFERLAGARPRHLSPLEHVCRPMARPQRRANLRDWVQLRETFE
jgi:hypothetical protein